MRHRINRYLLAYLALAVIPVVVIASASFLYAQRVLTQQVISQLDTIATIEKSRVQDYLESRRESFTGVVHRAQLAQLMERYIAGDTVAVAAMERALIQAKSEHAGFKELRLINPEGRVIVSTAAPEAGSSVPYYGELEKLRGPVRTIVIRLPDRQVRTLATGPLMPGDTRKGYLVIDTDAEDFTKLTAERQGLGQTGEIYMAERTYNGDALAITEYRFEPQDSQPVMITDKNDRSKPIIRALEREEASYTDTVDYRGVPVLAATRYISEQDWGLVVKMDKNEVYAPLRNFAISLVGLVVMVMVVAAFASLTLYRKERTLNRAKDEFVSLASHQLRTPASKVKVLTGMLLEGYEGTLTQQQIAALKNVYRTNDEQLAIINNLLRVVRFDSAKISLKKEAINVADHVQKAVREAADDIRERNQTLKVKLPSKPVTIIADSLSFDMVIENLLSNATKYTPEHGKIWITVRKLSGVLEIVVKDNGVGIARRDQKKLFHKFSRLDNPMSTKIGGTGVGLYLAHKIVTLHGGRLHVRSQPGKGTTFTVELPVSET